MNDKIKNKGTMFYTLIGIIVIIMVAVVAIHIMRTTYNPNLADEAEQDRFNNAIYDLHSQIPEIVSSAAYPVIWKAGHMMDSDGVNKYLNKSWSPEKGKEEMTKDLIQGFTEELNAQLCNKSDNCTPTKYVFDENGIPVTVDPINDTDIKISQSGRGMSFNVTLHMTSEYKEHYYDNRFTMTTDTPTRLYDMYDKAKDFSDSYENDVRIANTLALYARGIGNAYGACNGTLLNQGHFTHDPVDTFLRGDRKTLEELPKNPGDAVDLGAVPVATWVDETRFLTEPSYVPPGVDIGDGIPIDLIKNTLINGFDVKNKMDEQCKKLSDNQSQMEECLKDNDPDELWARYRGLIPEQEKVHAKLAAIDNWKMMYANTGTECDKFKEQTLDIIAEVATLIQDVSGAKDVRKTGDKNSQSDENNYNSSYKPSMDALAGTIQSLSDNLSDLNTTQTFNLNNIGNSLCNQTEADCYYDNTREYRRHCNSVLEKGKPHECDSCSDGCNARECVGGAYHTCDNKPGEDSPRDFRVYCEREVTDDDNKTTYVPYNGSCSVETCTCQCHPDQDTLITPITTDLYNIYEVFKTYDDNLLQLSEQVKKRASDMQASVDMVNSINQSTFLKEGYDVKSQINYRYVRFSEGSVSRSWCYPGYSIKNAGICGNKDLSITTYTIQVGIGALLALSVGCQPCIDFTYNTFPAIYTSEEVNYTINEKIVDDRNRIMLHNIFAGDDDLYGYNQTSKLFTHVAAEFVIYENKSVYTSSSAIIPMYFPLLTELCNTKCEGKCSEWSRVTDALLSDSCITYKGVNSTTGGC